MLAKNNRIRSRNIFINAVAVMLVYSSYYGGAAVMVFNLCLSYLES